MKGSCLELLRIRCHHDIHVFSDLSSFNVLFSFSHIIKSCQHRAFTVSSEREKALLVVDVEDFVGTSGITL